MGGLGPGWAGLGRTEVDWGDARLFCDLYVVGECLEPGQWVVGLSLGSSQRARTRWTGCDGTARASRTREPELGYDGARGVF